MSRRSRIAAFGSAGLLVLAGAVAAVVVSGTAGQVVAFVLIGFGLVMATGLVFLEVGLSEDRDRARTQPMGQKPRDGRPKARDGREQAGDGREQAGDGRERPRLARMRGQRRRLK